MPELDRCRGAILGLAVGDALGAPVEGLKGGHILQLYGGLEDYFDSTVAWADKPHRFRLPGLYTDDTQQALALADSLVRCRGLNPDHFRGLLLDLARSATGEPLGAHRGAGSSIAALIRADDEAIDLNRAGPVSASTGAMMRAAPCGLFFDEEEAVVRAGLGQALVTHRDPRSAVMAALAALAVFRMASGGWDRVEPATRLRELSDAAPGVEQMLEREFIHLIPIPLMARLGSAASGMRLLPRLTELPEQRMAFNQIIAEANRQYPDHKITEAGQGFVMASGLSALFIGLTAPDYEDAVKTAVLLGKDTDTTAAIAGAIAGARWGEDAIPERWRRGLRNGKQVGLRGDALCWREAEGLGLKDLVRMETELTILEVRERDAFILANTAKQDGEPGNRPPKKKPASPPAPAPVAEKKPDAPPTPTELIRRGKKQKPERKKAPWKN